LLDGLLAVLLAPRCVVCDAALDRPTLGPVCPACWNSILPLTPPLCDLCGDPLPTWRVVSVPLARCPRCRACPAHLTDAEQSDCTRDHFDRLFTRSSTKGDDHSQSRLVP